MFSLVSVILSIGGACLVPGPFQGCACLFPGLFWRGGCALGQVCRKYISMIDEELSVKPLHLLHSTISSYVSILDCCTEMYLFQPFDEKCRFHKPTGDAISVQYHFDTLTPNIQTIGSVRLPAPSDGYSGPGACVDETGSPWRQILPDVLLNLSTVMT